MCALVRIVISTPFTVLTANLSARISITIKTNLNQSVSKSFKNAYRTDSLPIQPS